MLEYALSAGLAGATLWALHRTRLACVIGNHDPGEHWHVIEDRGDSLIVALSCERCGKAVVTEILTPKWSSEVGTLYGP